MIINFEFNGARHEADVIKQPDKSINVIVKDAKLNKQFGSSFQYFLHNNALDFRPLNLCHSELFNLQSEIKNAIVQLGIRF